MKRTFGLMVVASLVCSVLAAPGAHATNRKPLDVPAIGNEAPVARSDLMDGGFEAGTPNPYWGEYSDNYGTPLCDEATCGADGSHTGDWFAWFGGTPAQEAAAISQTVTLDPGDDVLGFYLWIGIADVTSSLDVQIDGEDVFSVTEADIGSYPSYTEVTVDISAYADGGSHSLTFVSFKTDGGSANYFVDDVTIVGAPSTNGTVTGVVRHVGAPLAGVEVWLGGSRYQCTAGDGTFTFSGLPTGVPLVAATGEAFSLPCANSGFVNAQGQPLAMQAWDHKRWNEDWDEIILSPGEVKNISFDVVLRQAPVAVDDQASVNKGGSVVIDVAANDANPEGAAFEIVKMSGPSHGTATLGDDWKFVYTHDGSNTTTDSFTYLLDDSVMQSTQATVTISITGVLPAVLEAPTVGLHDPATGQWHLKDSGGGVTTFYYGDPGDVGFMGDWDCDGVATPGLFRQSDAFAYLRNANSQGIADIRFYFGNPSDIPLAGDFDGNGCDSLSIYRPSEQRFYVMNELGKNEGGLGAAEYSFVFGNPGDKPVVGDWDGDGIDEIGLHRESTGFFYYRNTLTQGKADGEFYFGDPGDRFVAGDWGTVDGMDTPAVFRPADATFYFRHTMTEGVADGSMSWGDAAFMPLAGRFGDLPGGGGINPPPPGTGSHPSSGTGWQLMQCSADVQTSVFRTSEECVRLRVERSLIPAPYRQCIYYPDPFNPQCTDHDQWEFSWFGPNGQVAGWSARYSYAGAFLSSITFRMEIAANALGAGEYRAELCRSVYPSSACVEDVLTTHFTIVN